ncbi:MAG TPA: PA0069 family radical SAM protein [Pelagibacterium sp.]|uniref:PA0069 family radical SAM protein n=1 Tax=Pelagibacterium sp. TaxID=1967288 RepID=UPI002BE54C19|nr:PA0069 family radical SAM protein [Pelagibacterium sp.]HWJ89228.1 PA0069 family radical SAM protein [Pelagibacterium sp.]
MDRISGEKTHLESRRKLFGTRDVDLLSRPVIESPKLRGRGASSNQSGRFEVHKREMFADGWEPEPDEDFETREHIERAKSIITRNVSPDIGFDRSINPYRGCEHGCSYCFARPSHAYLGHSAGIDFERDIYIKVNAAELLRAELANPRYRPKPIAIGTNTDPYQPLERKYKIMRSVLKVLLEAKHPVTIVTKSALIVRDLDILTKMARQGLVSVGISVTSMDHKLSRFMEPRASTPVRRLEALRLLSESGIPTRVMAAPMIPAVNDHELERILDAGKAQGATAASMILLRLPGEVRDIFREWLLKTYPDKVRHVMGLVRDYRNGQDNDPRFGSRFTGEGPYAVLMQQRFEKAAARLGLNEKSAPLRTDLFVHPPKETAQLSLF